MSRPKKALVSLIAIVMVCGLGAIVTSVGRKGEDTTKPAAGSRQTLKAEETEPASAPSSAVETVYAGLDNAGIPRPGEWSRPIYTLSAVQDGKITGYDEDGEQASMPSGTGAIDAALRTLDALLDPAADDKAWASSLMATLGKDAAGIEHPISNAPRYWWLQRRFTPDTLCTGTIYAHQTWTCNASNTYEGDLTDAIGTQQSYPAADIRFPVPSGFDSDSRVDPQERLSYQYDTVVIPMDDGPWHVTVHCPADRGPKAGRSKSQPGVVTDVAGNEVDPGQLHDGKVVRSVDATGFGTVQNPCVTVDVAVGGQSPFWYVGEERS